MATIKIDTFGGISPRTHPTLLADGMAVTAHNCKLESGKLVPLKNPSYAIFSGQRFLENNIEKISDAKSMHIWYNKDGISFDILIFPGVTWATPGNVADDYLTRLIVSGDTGTHQTPFLINDISERTNDPVLYLRDPNDGGKKVIVPLCKSALDAPIVERISENELGENRRYTRFFVTWVDRWGMESPTSKPSLVKNSDTGKDEDLEYNDGDKIKIFIKELSDKSDKSGIDMIRVYKIITGADTGRIQFVAEFNSNDVIENNGYITVWDKDENMGEILTEIESPPDDLRCIINVPGGFYCGISPSNPKTVFFSEVDMFYSWPTSYRYDVKDNIVALAVSNNTVYALTNGYPYAFSGTTPESMTVTEISTPASCVSVKSVCVYRDAVYFASNEGLMQISEMNCQNITRPFFTREQWEALNPASCLIGLHQEKLHLFFSKDELGNGYLINLLESGKIAITTHDEVASCLCENKATSELYYIKNK